MAKGKRGSKKLRARDVAIPVAFVTLLMLTGLATLFASGGSITIPGIGTVVIVGSNSAPGSGYNVSLTGTSPTSLIPPNTIGFQMAIIADFQDGSNSTISSASSGNLPSLTMLKGFDVVPGVSNVRINNKIVKQVRAQATVGITSPTGAALPSGSYAYFKINFTASNQKTGYTKWHYLEQQGAFTTYALVKLPELAVLPWEAFSDYCGRAFNGSLVCTNGPTPLTHRVNWSVRVQVTVSTPTNPQFALISGSTVSTADFNLDGSVTACTGCGGVNSASINTSGGESNAGENRGPSGPPGQSQQTSGLGSLSGTCLSLVRLLRFELCTDSALIASGQQGTADFSGGGIEGSGPGLGGSADISGGQDYGGYEGPAGIMQLVRPKGSLLPQTYLPLDLGRSRIFVHPLFALIMLVAYVAAIILGTFAIYKLLKH